MLMPRRPNYLLSDAGKVQAGKVHEARGPRAWYSGEACRGIVVGTEANMYAPQ